MTVFKMMRWMPCFFKEVTHLYCPACGATRAVKALLRLDIMEAIRCNPTVVYGAVMVTWCLFGVMLEYVFHKKIRCFQGRLWMLIVGLILFFGYGILRNFIVYQAGYDYLGDLM